MKRFTKSYSALALLYFVLHLAGAFIIGCLAPSRWDSSSNLAEGAVPTPVQGGLDALASVAVIVVIGFGIRFIAYRRLDADAKNNPLGWTLVAVGEVLNFAFNLWVVWIATEPVVDAGFAWLYGAYVAFIVTLASLALLIGVTLAGRRKARDAQVPAPEPAS